MMREDWTKVERFMESAGMTPIVTGDVNAVEVYVIAYQERSGFNFVVTSIRGTAGMADWSKVVFYPDFPTALGDWISRTMFGYDGKYWVNENA